MPVNRPARAKKYYTLAEANAALPLVRAIVRDIAALAAELQERYDRLARVRPPANASLGEAYREEVEHVQAQLERDRERMRGYEEELKDLGVELKDYRTGLIDFRCRMDGREVYLCWRLGEPEVAYWHELEAGFAGRQRIQPQEANV